MRIGFFGAAGEVTGSCFLVEDEGVRFMVDCGMFQGGQEARQKNMRALHFDFDVRTIDFVLLTHAHIDHSGLLPLLSVLGFRGPVYTTSATMQLLEILLKDSAHIQEKESEWQLRHQHRRGCSRKSPFYPPLYTVMQAETSLKLLRSVAYGEWLEPRDGVRVCFHDAGHILGSAWLEVELGQRGRARRLVFSGDLGMRNRCVLNDPEKPAGRADVVLVESTYGNRLHRSMAETEEEIVACFRRTLATHGNLIIPAFAVGRTQEIIYLLADLVRRERIPPLKVFLDSPMASEATRITLRNPDLLDAETLDLIDWIEAHPKLFKIDFVSEVSDSQALNQIRSGAVIISASGMCDAGRIKYHLRENLSRSECSILITGFQAAGTLGRRLVDGARLVHIFGEAVPVRARIYTVGGLSAHADQGQLIDWLSAFRAPPGALYVVHGESQASQALAETIHQRLHWPLPLLPERGTWIEV